MEYNRPWFGNFWTLDQVHTVIRDFTWAEVQRTKKHELYLTWILAKFLKAQSRRIHYVGFPSWGERDHASLQDFLEQDIAINDENFDTIIIDEADRIRPMMIQVKRFVSPGAVETDNFIEFVETQLRRYGLAPELNLLVEIQQAMRLDLKTIQRRVREMVFSMASVTVICHFADQKRIGLFAIHPNFSGVIWYPDAGEPPNA